MTVADIYSISEYLLDRDSHSETPQSRAGSQPLSQVQVALLRRRDLLILTDFQDFTSIRPVSFVCVFMVLICTNEPVYPQITASH